MSLIKEPKHIDFSTQSKPWNEKELAQFREIMNRIKSTNKNRKSRLTKLKTKPKQTT